MVTLKIAAVGFAVLNLVDARMDQHRIAKLAKANHGSLEYDFTRDANGEWVEFDPSPLRRYLRAQFGDEWFGDATAVKIQAAKISEADAKRLLDLRELKRLELGYCQPPPTLLKNLKQLQKLEVLSLAEWDISDADLAELRELHNLRRLILNDTQITGVGFKELKSLENLKRVGLHDANVTPAGLAAMAEQGSIESLDLWGNDPTPEHFEQLHKFARLSFLEWDVDWSVYRPHADELRRAYPNLFIYSP